MKIIFLSNMGQPSGFHGILLRKPWFFKAYAVGTFPISQSWMGTVGYSGFELKSD
jgi:hypothetical protein